MDAETLWSQHALEEQDLDSFSNQGIKHETSDGSFLQAKQLQFVRRRYERQLEKEIIEKLGSLCVGRLDKVNKVVVMEKVKGRVWSHYGHGQDGQLTLYPEEALFLMDTGALRLLSDGIMLSLQEAFELFIDHRLTFSHYLVYSQLSRLGYIVHRYSEEYGPNECGSATETATKSKRKAEPPQPMRAGSVKSPKADSPPSAVAPPTSWPSVKPPAYTRFDYSEIEFPAEGGMRPRKANLAENCRSERVHDQPEQTAASHGHFGYHSVMDYRDTKPTSKATNWSEFKLEHDSRLWELARMSSGAESLVAREDLTSVAAVLSKLRITKAVSYGTLVRNRVFCEDSLLFDVFQPDSKFKKSKRGRPAFRVVVRRSHDPLASFHEVASLSSAHGSVPLYWAVCDGGDVSFVGMTEEDMVPDFYIEKRRDKRRCKTTVTPGDTATIGS